ncbi:uncharacterized protein [Panulirus ornatus]|uniref:uncharacterized protein n=1 Tax=Panulirus ornatus TaxID=150431 RepID=UPI003A87DF66
MRCTRVPTWAWLYSGTLLLLTLATTTIIRTRRETSCSSGEVRKCLRRRLRAPLTWRDAQLLRYVRARMEPPPRVTSPLHPKNPPWAHLPTYNATQTYIMALTQGKVDGVFVEVGAQDGLWLSNTWWLEAARGWRGLLIEADPRNYQLLRASPRASSTLPFCVTTNLKVAKEQMVRTRSPSNATMGLLRTHQGRSKLSRYATETDLWAGQTWNTTCYSLFTVLAAAKYRQIDLLTFDVSGGGLEMTSEFLLMNNRLGKPYHVQLILYQDSLLEQFFNLDEVRENFQSYGYNLLKMGQVHYLIYHHSFNVVIA